MAGPLHAAVHGISREQIEHEILNSRDLSKKGRRRVGWRTPCGLRARRSLSPLNKEPSIWRTRHERAKNERLHYLRTNSSTGRALGAMSPRGRFREFSLMVWTAPANGLCPRWYVKSITTKRGASPMKITSENTCALTVNTKSKTSCGR
jgi:hypothetical protein